MTATSADELYSLLPAFVRLRDQTEGGGALQALIAVIAEQADVVSSGLDQLYDDQFIETCAPWVVPYIGDLVGFTPLRPLDPDQPAATRAEVASTIGYRRRKGTLAMLEQLLSDITQSTVTDANGVTRALAGWTGVAVEYFSRIAGTQYVRNHLRPAHAGVDVRSPMTAVDIDGAFDRAPRSVDVRRIASGRGRYNLANIGLFVWRLTAYENIGHPARSIGPNRYAFDPFGRDIPLVNRPALAGGSFTLTTRDDLPFELQRFPLFAGVSPYANAPAVGVSVDGVRVPDAAVGWCNLADWTAPKQAGIEVAVDPLLGRIAFAAAPAPDAAVLVDYAYSFSGDYGGGAYEPPVTAEQATLEAALPPPIITPFAAASMSDAAGEIIEISDSGIRQGDVSLTLGAGLVVTRAGDRQRPVLTGDLTVNGTPGASLTLRGIGIGGSLIVTGSGPLTIRLEHCTVLGAIDWGSNATGELVIDHCLSGGVIANSGVEVSVADSALDAASDTAAALCGPESGAAGRLTIVRSTLIGGVSARSITLLENSIITGPVVVTERQAGCVRYSYVPFSESQTPRRFRCQPDLEIESAIAQALLANPALSLTERDAIQDSVVAALRPAFTSRTSGQPGYLQLADASPAELRLSAEHGNEMGVFYGLYSARREANLTYRLNEYLRVGLEIGVIHAT